MYGYHLRHHSFFCAFQYIETPLFSSITRVPPCVFVFVFLPRANFVYFGMKLKSARGAPEKAIVDYALKVLGEESVYAMLLICFLSPKHDEEACILGIPYYFR